MGSKIAGRYVSVTQDFIIKCANMSGYDPSEKGTLQAVLHLLGFHVTEKDEKGKDVPAQIDILRNVKIRCKDRPYLCRTTTIYQGRLRKDFKYAGIYDKVDLLDVDTLPEITSHLVSDLDYELPSTDKVNTRKYTKKRDRNDTLDTNGTDFLGLISGEGVANE